MSKRRCKRNHRSRLSTRAANLVRGIVLELTGFALILGIFFAVQAPSTAEHANTNGQVASNSSDTEGDLQAYVAELLSGSGFGN